MTPLSASRLKTLNHCSWLYNCKYVNKLPDSSNDGARRGTVCHLILEVLLNDRHSDHLENAFKNGIISVEPCVRLIKKSMIKEGIEGDHEENFQTICKFIDVGLHCDYKMKGFEVQPPELSFNIKNESPKYNIIGFIDKFGLKDMPDGTKTARIVDYKSSKSKFAGSEAKNNIQGMMYQLALSKIYPDIKRSFVEFVFLKFTKNPVMGFSKNQNTLKGFEVYLEAITDFIESFDFDKAVSSFGYDNFEYKNLCGKGVVGMKEDGVTPIWNCSARFPKEIWEVRDEKKVECSFDSESEANDRLKERLKQESLKEDGKKLFIKRRDYGGCPRFYPQNYKNRNLA